MVSVQTKWATDFFNVAVVVVVSTRAGVHMNLAVAGAKAAVTAADMNLGIGASAQRWGALS